MKLVLCVFVVACHRMKGAIPIISISSRQILADFTSNWKIQSTATSAATGEVSAGLQASLNAFGETVNMKAGGALLVLLIP